MLSVSPVLYVPRCSGAVPDSVQVKAVLRTLPGRACLSGFEGVLWNPNPAEGAVLGCRTQDRIERVLLFVLEKKLVFTQTQVQSAFKRVINSE